MPKTPLVICNGLTSKCPIKCIHSIPHEPHLDYYDDAGYAQSLCIDGDSICGYVKGHHKNKCIEISS